MVQQADTTTREEGAGLWAAAWRRQGAIALWVALGWLVLGAWWCLDWGRNEGEIDIDSAPPIEAAFQVDVNRADWPELMQLPRVGETLAKRIVALRQREGSFRSADDLLRVQGIGRATLDEMLPNIAPIGAASLEAASLEEASVPGR